MKQTAFETLMGNLATRKNTTVEDIKSQAESNLCSPGLTDDEKHDIRKNETLAIEYMREIKTMYLSYSEVTVNGASFDDANDAIEQANEWLDEYGEQGGISDVVEIDVPEDAEYSDFSSCAQVSDYEEVAKKMIEDIEE